MRKVVRKIWQLRRHPLIYPVAARVRALLAPVFPMQGLADEVVSMEPVAASSESTFNRFHAAYGIEDPIKAINLALNKADPIQAMVLLLANRSRIGELAATMPAIVHAMRHSAQLRITSGDSDDVERLSAVRVCELLLSAEIDFETAKHLVWMISYQGDFSPRSRAWIQETLKQASQNILLQRTRAGLALYFLVACKGFESIPNTVDAELIKTYASNDLPTFLFAAALYGDRAQRSELRVAVMERVAALSSEELHLYDSKILEQLVARVNSLAATSQDQSSLSVRPAVAPQATGSVRKIFVGFFGQIRYEDYFYSDILPSFKSALLEQGLDVTFACASWDKTGKQELFDWSGLDFVHARLPPELSSVLAAPDIINLTDFSRYYPATADLVRKSNSGSGLLDVGVLRSNLGEGALLEFSTELRFQQSVIEKKMSRFEIEEPRMNQLRMFDRLAVLGRLAAEYKSRLHGADAYYLFTRPDVEFPLELLLKEMAKTSRANSLIVDHDDQAEFIGGIGDRYFGGGFDAIQAVAGTFDYLAQLAGRDDWQRYRHDIHAHRFIAQHLFRSGVEVRSLLAVDVPLRLHRGVINRLDIIRALEADLDSPNLVASHELHRKLQAFLSNEHHVLAAS